MFPAGQEERTVFFLAADAKVIGAQFPAVITKEAPYGSYLPCCCAAGTAADELHAGIRHYSSAGCLLLQIRTIIECQQQFFLIARIDGETVQTDVFQLLWLETHVDHAFQQDLLLCRQLWQNMDHSPDIRRICKSIFLIGCTGPDFIVHDAGKGILISRKQRWAGCDAAACCPQCCLVAVDSIGTQGAVFCLLIQMVKIVSSSLWRNGQNGILAIMPGIQQIDHFAVIVHGGRMVLQGAHHCRPLLIIQPGR